MSADLTPADPVRIVALSAGLSQPSSTRMLTDRLARATRAAGPALVEVVELRAFASAALTATLTGVVDEELTALHQRIAQAQGLIAVSPIFNGAYSGLFKLVLDTLPPGSLRGHPVLLGATGGTARHSLAITFTMAPLFEYLHAQVVPWPVFAATEDWGASAHLDARIAAAGRHFWLTLQAGRSGAAPGAADGSGAARLAPAAPLEPNSQLPGGPELDLPADFEELMRRLQAGE